MSQHTQRMNGKGLGIAACLPSLMGEVNVVERSPAEHEAAVLRMIERQERNQDLWTGEQLDFVPSHSEHTEFTEDTGEWHNPDGSEMDSEESDPEAEFYEFGP